MRKIIYILFALFVIGQTTAAQRVLTAKVLRPDTKQATTVSAPRLQAGADNNYWADAVNYYDADGYFNFDGFGSFYTVNITIDGTDVAIDGLVPVSSEWISYTTTNTIHGTYDAEAKTITVATPAWTGEDSNDYTIYGSLYYAGAECKSILLSGNFIDNPDQWGQYPLEMVNELVFDVNDDLTLLTSRTGYGTYVYTSNQWGTSGYGFLDFYKNSSISLIEDDAQLVVGTPNLHIEGINVVPGAELMRSVVIANKGKNATTIKLTCESDEVDVDYDMVLDGLGKQTAYVYFTPTVAGDFSTVLTFTADNGSVATINLTASVNEAPDFSPIVKNGDISFAVDGDTPFILSNDVTDFPVAVSTNNTTDGSSILNAYVTVPEGQTGVFSWKGLCNASYSIGGRIDVDGMSLLDNVYSYMQTWEQDDITNTVVLGEGRHTITFSYINYASWRVGSAPFTMHMYVYDLDFQTVDISEHSAINKTETLDMGRHYLDIVGVNDKMNVQLVNCGTAPLSVTAISTDGAFGGIVDGAEAQHGEFLNVPFTFIANEVGEYEGDIIISTTAGDFTVHCTASAEAIPYDYQSIVKEGVVGFNTGFEHPFLLDGDKAYSSTAYSEIGANALDSWIEILFDVPAGETAELSWTGHNSSGDYYYFMNEVILLDGTILEIDGERICDYAGEMNASSNTIDSELTKFSEGRHVVRFTYHKVDSYPAGQDCFTLSDVKLVTSSTKIQNATATSNAVRYYDINGRNVNAIQKGITIERKSDGTIRKVIR